MIYNYLKSMAIFCTVVETGSFSSAGNQIGLPRGKVSEQITRLETYLQIKLLQRSTRKISVTDEGLAFYNQVKTILPNAKRGVDEVKSFENDIKGIIRITATQDQYQTLLLPIIKEYNQAYPLVSFDFVISDQTVPIIDKSIDIAIRSGQLPDSNLIVRSLRSTKLKLYASPNIDEYPSTLKQFEDNKFSKVTVSRELRQMTLIRNQEVESLSITYQHSANSIASYLPLIEQGLGIGLLAETTGEKLVEQGRLVAVLPDWHSNELHLSMLTPSRIHMAKRTKILADMIYKHLGNEHPTNK